MFLQKTPGRHRLNAGNAWWSRPILQFLLIGVSIHFINVWMKYRESYRIPAPSQAQLKVAYDDWARATGRPPGKQQKSLMKNEKINDEVLFAEALRRDLPEKDPLIANLLLRDATFIGIDGGEKNKLKSVVGLGMLKGDPVVRRRLIQDMQVIGRTSHEGAQSSPSESALRQIYARQEAMWRLPAKLQVTQIYFSSADPEAYQRAVDLLHRLSKSPGLGNEAVRLGDTFLLGAHLPMQTLDKLSSSLGQAFAKALPRRETHGWVGPIKSGFGYHLVRVDKYIPGRQQPFEDVKDVLVSVWRSEQENKCLSDFIADLRSQYKVVQ